MDNDVGIIILAGGSSTRMGFPKGLLQYQNLYWIEEQMRRLNPLKSDIHIGLGFDFQLYLDALPFLKHCQNEAMSYQNNIVQAYINPQPQEGPFSTLRFIIENLSKHYDKYIICPVDVPLPSLALLDKLLKPKDVDIVIPQYEGKNGHPIVVSSKVIKEILSSHYSRLDYLIKSYDTSALKYILTVEHDVTFNLNTENDWKNYLSTISHYNKF